MRIKHAREEKCLTQEDMISEGFERRYYQRIEAGEVNLTLQTLHRLAAVLNTQVQDLLPKLPSGKKLE